MRGVLATFGTFLKIGLIFGVGVGVVGVGGYVGVCSVTELECMGETSQVERPAQNTPDSTALAPTETARNTDQRTETPLTTRAEPSETQNTQIEGPDPPDYPPRTAKEWDRTLLQSNAFPGDPGETIAEGDNWEVSSTDVERFLAEDVNDYREANGLDRLEYSHALASVSREHSEDMADRGYFSHENPEGERAWDRWGSGDCRTWYGENIFQSWANAPLEGKGDYLRTADALAERSLVGWQNSPPHNDALLAESWDAVGYGVYFVYSDDDDGSYKMYVTMNMCTYNENEKHPSDR